MARLNWSISITPIESTAAGVDGGPIQTETISYNFKRSLGGGNNNGTWDGNDSTEWSNGVHTHITSDGGSIGTSSNDGLWIKNTGYVYDSSQADNKGTIKDDTAVVQIKRSTAILCSLSSGEGMFIPAVYGGVTFNLVKSAGNAVAVEYAVFT